MKFKPLFLYFSRDSRIARLHLKYRKLKEDATQVLRTIAEKSNLKNNEDVVGWILFFLHEEKDLSSKLKYLDNKITLYRHKILWLEYKRSHA
jgi:transcriptional regulatory protein LevR